ncbi:MAG: hypothetical protein NT027_20115 [Proteobacteria bacterium]|nr:hypothetical protein [Pseudomonadota bacterium]
MSKDEKSNIVDLSQARRTVDKGIKKPSSGSPNKQGRDDAYKKALGKQKGFGRLQTTNIKWYHYLQTILVLFLVAWMMKSCQGS